MPHPTKSDLIQEHEALAALLSPLPHESLTDALKRLLADFTGVPRPPAPGAPPPPSPFLPRTETPAEPDDDPADPKPSWNPFLGHDAPDYLAWLARRRERIAVQPL